MKLINTLFALLGSALLLAGTALAQDKPAQEKNDSKPVPKPNRPVTIDRSAALANFLKLSDDQREKVKPILEEELEQQRALRQDKTVTPENRMAKIKEIRESTSAKVKPILNDEQWQKWDRMRNAKPRTATAGGAAAPAAPGAPAAPKPPVQPAPAK